MAFFKTAKPRGFSYEPRYYDERKENLQRRTQRIEAEMGVGTLPAGTRIRGAFHEARRAKPTNIFTPTGTLGKIIRLVCIALIVAIFYFVARAVGTMLTDRVLRTPTAPIERFIE